jgi:hypothetical protein
MKFASLLIFPWVRSLTRRIYNPLPSRPGPPAELEQVELLARPNIQFESTCPHFKSNHFSEPEYCTSSYRQVRQEASAYIGEDTPTLGFPSHHSSGAEAPKAMTELQSLGPIPGQGVQILRWLLLAVMWGLFLAWNFFWWARCTVWFGTNLLGKQWKIDLDSGYFDQYGELPFNICLWAISLWLECVPRTSRAIKSSGGGPATECSCQPMSGMGDEAQC